MGVKPNTWEAMSYTHRGPGNPDGVIADDHVHLSFNETHTGTHVTHPATQYDWRWCLVEQIGFVGAYFRYAWQGSGLIWTGIGLGAGGGPHGGTVGGTPPRGIYLSHEVTTRRITLSLAAEYGFTYVSGPLTDDYNTSTVTFKHSSQIEVWFNYVEGGGMQIRGTYYDQSSVLHTNELLSVLNKSPVTTDWLRPWFGQYAAATGTYTPPVYCWDPNLQQQVQCGGGFWTPTGSGSAQGWLAEVQGDYYGRPTGDFI